MVVTYANFLAEKGHQVSILTNRLDTVFEVSSFVKIKKIRLRTKIGTIVTAILGRFDYDVIVADIIVLATLLSVRNWPRVLYFAQDNDTSYYKDRLRQDFVDLLYELALGKLDIPCIAVSEGLSRELEKYTHNTRVIPNGIDLAEFYHDPDDRLLRLKGDRKAILVFGRRDYRKGLDIAIEVLGELALKVEKSAFEIWIVGDNLPQTCLPFNTRNFSYVSSDRLRTILSSADVFLYPSRHEGLPLFILEAMACKCPIVTTHVVGIVKHLDNGWSMEIGDVQGLTEGILTILENEAFRKDLIASALSLVQRFSLTTSKKAFEESVRTYADRD